jgi:phosphopantetheinyl transferase
VQGIIGIKAIHWSYTLQEALRHAAEVDRWCGVPKEIESAVLTRRSEWIASRWCAKQLLEAQKIEALLASDPVHGFPVLLDPIAKNPLPLSISWAHSGTQVAVALSTFSVGIDTEPLDRKVENVLPRISKTLEWQSIEKKMKEGMVSYSPALAVWCAKEAAAKASGLGMKWGLRNFHLSTGENGLWEVTLDRSGPKATPDLVVTVFPQNGQLVAIAANRTQLLEGVTWL